MKTAVITGTSTVLCPNCARTKPIPSHLISRCDDHDDDGTFFCLVTNLSATTLEELDRRERPFREGGR
jgi:hypothetical protein